MIAIYASVDAEECSKQGDFKEGLYFDDYQWDEITEAAYSDDELKKRVKKLNKIYISDTLILMEDSNNTMVRKYMRIK